MNKSLIWIVAALAILALIVAGYFYFKGPEKTPEQKAMESAAAGALPEFAPTSNPLEGMPEINPVEKTNPFKGLDTNPF